MDAYGFDKSQQCLLQQHTNATLSIAIPTHNFQKIVSLVVRQNYATLRLHNSENVCYPFAL